MEKYGKYKKTNVEFLDEIPENWIEKRMRFVGYLYGGLSGKSADDFNKAGDENNKYFIPFTNIANNLVIDPNNLQTVIIKKDEKQNNVQNGDLFFLMSSENYDDVGKSAVLSNELPETYLNSFCKGFRITQGNIDSKFLNYQLHSKQHRHNLLIGANGFTRINLKIDKVKDLFIALPPTPKEQTAIANYLDRKTTEIDELIADKKRLLELYEEEKTAIINELVTGKKVWDGKAWTKPAKVKHSGIEWLGEIPEHWIRTKLKYVSEKIGDGIHATPKYIENSEYKFVNGNNLYDGAIKYFDNTKSVSEDEYKGLKKDIKEGTVLISINGTIGKLAFYKNEKIILGKSAAYIETTNDLFNKFLFYIFQTHYVKTQFELSYSGSTINNLSLYTLNNLDIVLPSIEEQENIIQELESNLKEYVSGINRVLKLIELLTEYRTALISEVVTGKIKVLNLDFKD